jgi:hypothetical protein
MPQICIIHFNKFFLPFTISLAALGQYIHTTFGYYVYNLCTWFSTFQLLRIYMYTLLYIVIYALCTHISCANLPPSCQLNIPLLCGQEILVATAAFLLCESCMGKFRILCTKSCGVMVMAGASRTNLLD